MTRRIHSLMKDAYHRDAVGSALEENDVPLNATTAIALPNVIASRGPGTCGVSRQILKHRYQRIGVVLSLGLAPLARRVVPDAFKVALGSRREAIVRHGLPSFAA